MKKAVLLSVAVMLSQGCIVSPPLRDPRAGAETAGGYSRPFGDAGLAEAWHEAFGSASLDALVEKALADNPGVLQTRLRLAQAEEVAAQSRAALLPHAEAGADAKRTKERGKEGADAYGIRGAAGFELDLWGKYRAARDADRLSRDASAEDVRTAEITLVASVVEAWLDVAALREEEALLLGQIETNRLVYGLQRRRYENGAASALDVLQQKEAVAAAETELPDIELGQESALRRLALLTGGNPLAPPEVAEKALPAPIPLPDAGIPARLLERRPDIRAAWKRVASADAAAASAHAARLPNVSLSASGALAGASLARLVDGWALSLAGDILAPVFDGGARKAEERRKRLLADERFQAYRETVLNALAEVEDALSRNDHQGRKVAALKRRRETAKDALRQAEIAYAGGETEYLSVLNGSLSVQDLERRIVRERRNGIAHRVALARALGGGGK
jgi:multidrug efflux system outer membrane protein